jgi:hypothetical protein
MVYGSVYAVGCSLLWFVEIVENVMLFEILLFKKNF